MITTKKIYQNFYQGNSQSAKAQGILKSYMYASCTLYRTGTHGHPYTKPFINGFLQYCLHRVALKSYLDAIAGPECSSIVVMSQCTHVTSQLHG